MEYFGTQVVGDRPARTLEERLGRCYELAGYAIALSFRVPDETIMIHGTIHGVRAPRRIGHAWLLLPDRRIWESATGAFYPIDVWKIMARPEIDQTYTGQQTRQHIVAYGDWGPWADHVTTSRYITDLTPGI